MFKQIEVNTPSHCYPIYIGASFSELLEHFLSQHISEQCVVISNDTVAPLYLPTLQAILPEIVPIILPDGEQYKNLQSLQTVYDALLTHNTHRSATIIALGGGVIGDLAGFAAATYQRGVSFIQIPTTLLSQVDSSVGGKTAVNHPLGKNMIGAFYQPQAVFSALDVFQTLPDREFSAGMAEVIKYALLGDADFFDYLDTHMDTLMARNEADLVKTIAHCCTMKAHIVAQDERESGVRALLNLGHTFAHAIETECGYGNWLHGEAVAAGMVLAARLSHYWGYIEQETIERIRVLLRRANLPDAPPVFEFSRWINHMARDKKASPQGVRFVVLEKIGRAIIRTGEEDALHFALQPWLTD